MTDPQPQIVPLMTIGIEGVPDLIRWVAAGDTPEQRKQRADFAKEAIAEALAQVDHEKFNKALRDEARRLTRGDPR
jgi:hypothetical protein